MSKPTYCHECKHWVTKGYSRFAWCSKATELVQQLGIPAHDRITVRRDGDATKCPGAAERREIRLADYLETTTEF